MKTFHFLLKQGLRGLMLFLLLSCEHENLPIVDNTGSEYQLIRSTFEEIAEKRRIYTSAEECQQLFLTNPSPVEKWESTERLFQNVTEKSVFESDDDSAFNWLPDAEMTVTVPDLIINDTIWAEATPYVYKKGSYTRPYYNEKRANKNKILMRPYAALSLTGEITYCTRVCNYIFTIENKGTGTRSDIRGTWTQTIPIARSTILSEK